MVSVSSRSDSGFASYNHRSCVHGAHCEPHLGLLRCRLLGCSDLSPRKRPRFTRPAQVPSARGVRLRAAVRHPRDPRASSARARRDGLGQVRFGGAPCGACDRSPTVAPVHGEGRPNRCVQLFLRAPSDSALRSSSTTRARKPDRTFRACRLSMREGSMLCRVVRTWRSASLLLPLGPPPRHLLIGRHRKGFEDPVLSLARPPRSALTGSVVPISLQDCMCEERRARARAHNCLRASSTDGWNASNN